MKKYQRAFVMFLGILLFVVLTLYTGYGIQELLPNHLFIAEVYKRVCLLLLGITCIGLRWGGNVLDKFNMLQAQLNSFVFIVFIAQLIYAIFLVLFDMLALFNINIPLLNGLGFTLMEVFVVMSIYGAIWGKYLYQVRKEVVHFDDLPESFDGIKIVQISDVHSGSFDNVKAVKAGIKILKEQQADIFVFTGDLVNNSAQEFEMWKDVFKGITGALGQYSILGNHDYGDYGRRDSTEAKEANLNSLKKHHDDIGWRLLLNEHVAIDKDGHKLILAGVENRGDGFSRHGDIDKALDGVEDNSFVVLLSHDPSHRDKVVKDHEKRVHVTLSGHTHGMQMGFNFSRFKWSPIKYRYKRRAGLYTEKGKHLYVNRGFGFLGLSARIGMRPEITVIELRKK